MRCVHGGLEHVIQQVLPPLIAARLKMLKSSSEVTEFTLSLTQSLTVLFTSLVHPDKQRMTDCAFLNPQLRKINALLNIDAEHSPLSDAMIQLHQYYCQENDKQAARVIVIEYLNKELPACFNESTENNASKQRIRQQASVPAITYDQDEIELSSIQSYKGGFDQREVQLALRYLFRKHHEAVYVPRFNDLSGEQADLPLLALKEQGYQYVAFSLEADVEHKEKHQIAVWIDLTESPYLVTLYDSQLNKEITKPHLTKLLGEHEYVIKNGKSPYHLQTDSWSCGVYVIAHLQRAFQGKLPTEEKEHLDVGLRVRQYYGAFKRQREIEAEALHAAERNDSYKRRLLEILEREINNHPVLKSLYDLLHIELWGILHSDEVHTRTNQSDEYRRTRPLHLAVMEYQDSKSRDPLGLFILQAAEIFQDKALPEYETLLTQVIQKSIAAKKDENFRTRGLALAIYADAVRTMEESFNNNLAEQRNFLGELLLKLINGRDARANLEELFLIFGWVKNLLAAAFYETMPSKKHQRCESLRHVPTRKRKAGMS